ncbi:hypothetical protein A3J20_04910 [Candidatus Gottesmanbacteria bacterium RIFCSPLOWO2_02_FULL_42_29]|nr:MAG: hypothetical protein UV09_C0006G0009 [Candidatus Gottesmanbacteria bacterium GW2011_GWA2_42_18]OGG39538.1 MAG: hypothetical protein A3J20_04910 [Candidatus Gottesmanbacteria bacterium RIFCSPLOWO2_02_FULL_42_29]
MKLKTLILKNLRNEDLPEFNELVKQNNANILLQFANSRIPDLGNQLFNEIYNLKQRLESSIK